MVALRRPWAADLHHFWFHTLDPADWYGGSSALDHELHRRFAGEWQALRRREAGGFLNRPRDALAAVLLLDQVPRNIHRGSPLAFASDPLARAITYAVLTRKWHHLLTPKERQFLYMPLMHSEDIADQRLSLALFAELGRSLRFARSHHAMIARFGRFPHRNSTLGRTTTDAEQAAIDAGHAW